MKKEGGNYGKRAPRFFLMIAGFVFLFFLTRPMFGSPIILFEATFSDGGTPIQGARTVTISLNSETDLLVNDPGQKIWEETFSSVFFKDGGYLALELGRKTPLKSDYFKGSKLHFVVAVEGILGLVSVPLRSVPYAMFSELAESAVQVDTAVITGNIPVSQLRGVYPGITGLGTLTTTLNVATDFAVDFNTLFVDSRSHRVGIGTRTPRYELDINGILGLSNGAIVFPDGTELRSALIRPVTSEFVQTGNMIIHADSDADGQGELFFKVGNRSILKVVNNGFIGIHQLVPLSTLDIGGEIRIGSSDLIPQAGMIRYVGVFEGYNGFGWQRLDSPSNAAAGWKVDNARKKITLEREGYKVGIGVADPTMALEVNGGVKADLFIGKFQGNGADITHINPENFTGVLSVSKGGTGKKTLTRYGLLVGNDTGDIISLPPLGPGEFVFGTEFGIPKVGPLTPGNGIDIVYDSGKVKFSLGRRIGIGVLDPFQALEVSGAIKISSTIQGTPGTIQFNSNTKRFEGYDGQNWKKLDIQLEEGYIRRNAQGGYLYLGAETDRMGLGRVPSLNFRLDVSGNINASGYYQNGLPFPWVRTGNDIVYASGNVGIGVASPSALLHLGSGTETAPFLKLTPGSLLAAPQSGAVEFDGETLFYTDSNRFRHAVVNTDATQNITNKILRQNQIGDNKVFGIWETVAPLHIGSSRYPLSFSSTTWGITAAGEASFQKVTVGGMHLFESTIESALPIGLKTVTGNISIDVGNQDFTINHSLFVVKGGSGRVGIGTSSPNNAYLVDVSGALNAKAIHINGQPVILNEAAGGDLTGNYPNPALTTTGVVPGIYGSNSDVAQFTVDAKGRITAIQNIPLVGSFPSGPAGGDLAGTFPNPHLAASGVTAGTYGSSTSLGRFTVDAKGRVTAVSTIPIEGVPPGGSAGGDLSGVYPNPRIIKLQGYAVSDQAPLSGQALVWNSGTQRWEPTTGVTPTGNAGGDLAGVYPNPVLADVLQTPGIFGSPTESARFTVDAKGRITTVSTVPISGVTPAGQAGGDLAGTYPNPVLKVTGVIAGNYGSATQVAQINVDAKGRILSAAPITIVGVQPGGAAGGDLGGSYPNPTVLKIQGYPVSAATPLAGQALVWNGASLKWEPATGVTPTGNAGGDLTGKYPNPELTVTNVTAGTYGSSTSVPRLSVDTKGRITTVNEVTITGTLPLGPAGGDLAGHYPNPDLKTIPNVAGTYGSSNTIARISVDTKGRISSVSTVNVSGAPPIGPAGGDLSGTYPSPGVVKLRGFDISATAPVEGQALVWNAALLKWEPRDGVPPIGNAGGDLTGTYPNPALMTQGLVTPGTYGTSTAVAQLTVDEKGRVTSVRNVTITGAPATGPAGGDLAGNYPDPSLVTLIELTPGTYGSATALGKFTVDAKGRVTSVTTVNISGVPPGGTAGGDLGGTYPNPTVTRLQGRGVAAAIPLNGYVLVWNNANSLWEPTLGATPTGSAGGDLTGTYPNPALMTQGSVTPGTYGTSTAVAQFAVDSKGRVSSVQNVSISGALPRGPAGGDLMGSYPNPELVTINGLVSGTYGSATAIGKITVDTKGRIVSVTTVNITGVSPGGSAGGDLTGIYPNPAVAKLRGYAVSSAAPGNGQALVWNNSASQWEPTTGVAPTGNAGGDLSGVYPNPVLASISGLASGTYGSATQNTRIVVDAKGRVTSVNVVDITGVAPTGEAGGDLAGNYPNPQLRTIAGLVAGTYGSATTVGQFSVDGKGRVTSVTSLTISGVTPSGSAGGDLSGTYPHPNVAKIQGRSVSSSTPNAGQVLAWSGSVWEPVTGVTPTGSAGGDLAGSYPNPTLKLMGVTPGTYGSETTIPQLEVDAKGRIVTINNKLISGTTPTGSAGGDLAGTYPNPVLKTTGVLEGTYGSGTQVAQLRLDSKGRVINASNVTISGIAPSGNAGGDLAGTYPNPALLTISGLTAGTYGSSTAVPQLSVDAKGRITSVNVVTLASVTPGGSAGGDITGTYPNPTLTETGVVAGTYGSVSGVGQLTVDEKGRLISAATLTISGVVPGGSAGGDLSGTYPAPTVARLQGRLVSNTTPALNHILKWDGSQWIPTADIGTTYGVIPTGGIQLSGIDFGLINGSSPGQILRWTGSAWGLSTEGASWSMNGGAATYSDIVYATGTFGGSISGNFPSGPGIKMLWLPQKAAFRAGYVDAAQWDVANIGNFSVAFGRATRASGAHSVVAGGEFNVASGDYASILGGYSNTSAGNFSSVLGGYANSASGLYSVAGGYYASAQHAGTFVWADSSSSTPFVSEAANEFAVRSIGGVRFETGASAVSRAFEVKNASRSHFYIQRDGNIGIGTTTPKGVLHVVTGISDTLVVTANKVGIGTTAPAYALDVNGDIRATTITQGSDIRWKEDIHTLSQSLDKLLRLRGVSFMWNRKNYPDKRFSEGRQIGLIAQEVEKVFPELVQTDPNGFKSVAYGNVVSVLIEALKEEYDTYKKKEKQLTIQEKRLDELEKENEILKREIEKIKARY